ncbi:unnamed protein product [Rotaria sp. Silwood1]|nr:unnamed protein product [Rotaria sp. Silwood1]CAF1355583.1 unnamed protein product [Rotaria sp. Silwood1]CAF3550145.1 unnamed protein product [Rotaria sp. Silwood1]CAF4707373.1 unnamed protein product [Rotaria sp. Silwood1]
MGCSSSKNFTSDIISKHFSLHNEESLSITKTIPQSIRFLENYLIIWLYDETSNKFENEIKQLRTLIYGLKTFNNIDACITFIDNIQDEKVFLIISGIHRTFERFHHLTQLEKLYIFDSSHKQNDEKYQILKYDIIHNIDNLYKQLQEDMKLCEMDLILITTVFIPSEEISFSSKLTKQQASFLFTQMLKEIIARLKFESCSKDVFIDFCRLYYMNNNEQLHIIDEFAKNYRPNKALWWLTNQCFISKILDRVQRTHEIDIIYKLGFFIKQINIQLNHLYEENSLLMKTISIVYRGKTMSSIEFDTTVKNNCGGFLAFTNFLIATIDKKDAIDFVDRRLTMHPNMTGIIFEINIDQTKFNEKSPFALLKDADMNRNEICFYMSTVFCIESIEQTMNGTIIIWFVKLKLIDVNDQQLLRIVAPTRNDDIHLNPGYCLGKLLMEMGEYKRAEQFLLELLHDPSVRSQPRRLVRVHSGLAAIYTYNNQYVNALDHYQLALETSLTYLQSNHPDLVPIYKAIGDNYLHQKDYIHALENYEKAIELLEQGTSQMNADIIIDLHICINKAKQFIEMLIDIGKPSNRTLDGFICHANSTFENGLITTIVNNNTKLVNNKEYDVIIIGVEFASLISARELSRRDRSVLILEAKNRIDVADHISVLLGNGTRLKPFSISDLYPKLCELMTIQTYDHMTMQERLKQISSSFDYHDNMRQILDTYLSMNTQYDLRKSGFLDHLCFWALEDYDTIRTSDKTSRSKIREGESALVQAILDDCQDVNLLLFTSVISVHRTEDKKVRIQTQSQQVFNVRTTIITVPLNPLHNIEFQSTLEFEKLCAIAEGQCRGDTKFWAKLKNSIEGTVIVCFGPDNALDIRDIVAVERELQKFLPNCKVEHVFGHDWRNGSFVESTWSWWRGSIDGALESGLTSVRQVQQYFRSQTI